MRRSWILVVLLFVGAFVFGCNDSKKKVYITEEPAFKAVEIVGPSEISVDEMTTLTVIGDGCARVWSGTWASTDSSIAYVFSDGRVVGRKAGQVDISFKFDDKIEDKQTLRVTGQAKQAATLMVVPENPLTLEEAETVDFKAGVCNTDNTHTDVTYRAVYTSDMPEVFSVDSLGHGVARKVGRAIVKVELTNPDNTKLSQLVNVTVNQLTRSLSSLAILVKDNCLEVALSSSTLLEVLAKFSDNSSGFIYDVTWSYSTGLASIQSNTLTAVASGEFDLTCAKDGRTSQVVKVKIASSATPPPPPAPQTLTLIKGSNDPIGVNGTVQLGLQSTTSYSSLTWLITPAGAGSVDANKVFTATQGGRIKIKARTDGNNPAESNEVEVIVYRNRGIIAGTYYCKKSEGDTSLAQGSGDVQVVSSQNGWSGQTTSIKSISGVDYYVFDGGIGAGTKVDWNLKRGSAYYPDNTTPSDTDCVDNGYGGKKFVHTAE